jgi:hypothetical protein
MTETKTKTTTKRKRKKTSDKPRAKNHNKKRWVATVNTDSTHPAPGLFKKSASAIARALASKKVSPKGPTSGMRMLNYFINRGGKGLSKTRGAELKKTKKLLSKRIQSARQRQHNLKFQGRITCQSERQLNGPKKMSVKGSPLPLRLENLYAKRSIMFAKESTARVLPSKPSPSDSPKPAGRE